MKAEVAHNYGWTDKEINSMPIKTFYEYWIAIVPIQAKKTLNDINVASFCNMKKSDRKLFFNSMKRATKMFINYSDGKLASFKNIYSRIKLNNG